MYWRIADFDNGMEFLRGSKEDCLPPKSREKLFGEDAPDVVDHIDDVLDEMKRHVDQHTRPSVRDLLKPW